MGLLRDIGKFFITSSTPSTPSTPSAITASDIWSDLITIGNSKAQEFAAAYRCMTLIAGLISVMPLRVRERITPINAKLPKPLLYEKKYAQMLDKVLTSFPDGRDDAKTFCRNMVMDLLRDGNFFALIEKNTMGFVTGIYPISQSEITQITSPSFPFRRLTYTTSLMGMPVILDRDMIHISAPRFVKRPTSYEGSDLRPYLLGVPPLKAAKSAMDIGVDLDDFVRAYFTHAITGDIVISSGDPVNGLTNQQITDLADAFKKRNEGSKNFRRPLLVPGHAKVSSLKTQPSSGQLIQLRHFTIDEVARAFGIPKEFMNTAATSGWGTGIEIIGRHLHRFTINPWATLIESALASRLLPPRIFNFYEIHFDDSALLRGDSKTFAEYAAKALGGPGAQGWATINEIRRDAGLTPLADSLYDKVIISGGTEQNREEDKKSAAAQTAESE